MNWKQLVGICAKNSTFFSRVILRIMGNSQATEIPPTMRRIALTAPNSDMTKSTLIIEQVPMPTPQSGEVLIKVIAAPVNPSDYGEWTHVLPGEKFEAKAIGKEGSGIVVAAGGGYYANSCVGSKVGFVTNVKGQGSYSEYTVVDALKGVFPLPEEIPCEDAASHFVNPYTVVGILETVKIRYSACGGKGTPGFIHTGAASQLGQMMVKLCKQEGITLINIVRREQQAETLRGLGAEHVIVSEGDWETKLDELISKHDIRIAFDCVAGEMTGTLLKHLPNKGSIFVYGKLSPNNCSNIEPLDLIYRRKHVEGWLLPTWLTEGDSVTMLMRIRSATALVHAGLGAGGWASSQFVDCSLDNMWDNFLQMYNDSGFTGKKLRIRFDQVTTTTSGATAALSDQES